MRKDLSAMSRSRYGIVIITMALIVLMGCASHRPAMPSIDLPPEPVKPKIQSSVIVHNNIPWVAYSLSDSLKLYEFLLRKDSYEEKLQFRIDTMNKTLKDK